MPLNFYNQTIELQLLQFETLFSKKCKNYITYLLMKYKYNIAKKYANSILFLSMYTYEKQFSNIWSTIQNGPFLCWFLVIRINVPCLFRKCPIQQKEIQARKPLKHFKNYLIFLEWLYGLYYCYYYYYYINAKYVW